MKFGADPKDQARINGLQAAARIAIIPDLVRMRALTSVQQPCSNPSKYPEMSRNALVQKYGYLQVFCTLEKPLANYRAAFTRQRPLVRSQHRPLRKVLFCRKNTEDENWVVDCRGPLYTVVHQPARTAVNTREMFAQRIHRFARVFEQRQTRVILEP